MSRVDLVVDVAFQVNEGLRRRPRRRCVLVEAFGGAGRCCLRDLEVHRDGRALRYRTRSGHPGLERRRAVTAEGGGSISTGSVGISGTDKTLGPARLNIPSKTVGGQTLNIPQLESVGFIEDEGLAMLHAGEQVVPAANVDRGRQGGDQYVEIGDVIIQGDADRHEVERGLSRALNSYNIGR